MNELKLDGPFNLLTDAGWQSEKPGAYIWAVKCENGFRPFYVGKTKRSVAGRIREHIRDYLSGLYFVHDVDYLASEGVISEAKPPREPNVGNYEVTAREFDEHARAVTRFLNGVYMFVWDGDTLVSEIAYVEGALIEKLGIKNFPCKGSETYWLENFKRGSRRSDGSRREWTVHCETEILGLEDRKLYI